MFDLTGKVALVTGASRGIGRAIAARLSEQGAIVVAAARDDHAKGTVADLMAGGRQAEAVSLDVTDAVAVGRLPGHIVERFGRLDVVVSNAGIARDQLGRRSNGKRRPDQLRCVKGRADRFCEGSCSRAGLARDHRQHHRTGYD